MRFRRQVRQGNAYSAGPLERAKLSNTVPVSEVSSFLGTH
jgi:hypothetical protein